jgi:hypothetical protein
VNRNVYIEKKCGKEAHGWILKRKAGSEHIRADIKQKPGNWAHTRIYWKEAREVSTYARILKRSAASEQEQRYRTEARQEKMRVDFEKKGGKWAHTRGYWTDKRAQARILKRSAGSEHLRADIEKKRGKGALTRGYWTEERQVSRSAYWGQTMRGWRDHGRMAEETQSLGAVAFPRKAGQHSTNVYSVQCYMFTVA